MLVTVSSALLPLWTHHNRQQYRHHNQFPTLGEVDDATSGVLSSSLSTFTIDTNDTTSIHHELGPEEAPRIRMVPCIDMTRSTGVRIDVIERDVRPDMALELGRFTDEFFIPNRISFRNKVISRRHAVIWAIGHKVRFLFFSSFFFFFQTTAHI